MEIETPESNDFTIYSKSGCIDCNKVKDLLKNNKQKYLVIVCDDYLFDDKEIFLSIMNNYTNCEWNRFPMVFHNGKFIGGFNETKIYVDKLLAFNFYRNEF